MMATAAKTAPAKKAPSKAAKKAAPSKAAPVAKKAPAKTAPIKSVAKKAPAKVAAKKVAPVKSAPAKKAAGKAPASASQEFTVHGYRVGSDSAVFADAFVKGGKDRNHVNEIAAKGVSATTRSGAVKNVASLMSAIFTQLTEEKGYKVESTFRLVPPAAVLKKMDKAASA